MTEYQPGICNIGKNEIRKRYTLALIGFVIAAIISYIILSFSLPIWALIFPFIALILGFEGFYQGYFKFCAGYAAKGIYDSDNSKNKVTDAESHEKDLKKARDIHLYVIISSLIIIAIVYFVFFTKYL